MTDLNCSLHETNPQSRIGRFHLKPLRVPRLGLPVRGPIGRPLLNIQAFCRALGARFWPSRARFRGVRTRSPTRPMNR